MKKIFCLILSLVLFIGCLGSFISCGNKKNDSCYDKLSQTEKKVFDILIFNISNKFKNPQSVKVIKISKIGQLDDGNVYASIELQGENTFGGSTSSLYYLNSASNSKYRFVESSTFMVDMVNATINGEDFPKYNYLYEDAATDKKLADGIEKKFNDAINEYWAKKGL